jgi:hypothetical protein
MPSQTVEQEDVMRKACCATASRLSLLSVKEFVRRIPLKKFDKVHKS